MRMDTINGLGCLFDEVSGEIGTLNFGYRTFGAETELDELFHRFTLLLQYRNQKVMDIPNS